MEEVTVKNIKIYVVQHPFCEDKRVMAKSAEEAINKWKEYAKQRLCQGDIIDYASNIKGVYLMSEDNNVIC
jgi:hypothetical protein